MKNTRRARIRAKLYQEQDGNCASCGKDMVLFGEDNPHDLACLQGVGTGKKSLICFECVTAKNRKQSLDMMAENPEEVWRISGRRPGDIDHLTDFQKELRLLSKNQGLKGRMAGHLIKSGYRCPLCGKAMHPSEAHAGLLTFDHIIPVSRGGGNKPDNLQLVHAICNRTKGNMMPREWWAWQKSGLTKREWLRRNTVQK